MSLSSFCYWWTHKASGENVTSGPAEPLDAEAQFRLGLKFANASADSHDYLQAALWYGKAALQNHALAQFNLSVMYAQGQGVSRDQNTSFMWLNRSAALGDPGAQYTLGVRQHLACREAGEGASNEMRIEALKWVRLAAAQGYCGAERACAFVVAGMSLAEVAEGERRATVFRPGILGSPTSDPSAA